MKTAKRQNARPQSELDESQGMRVSREVHRRPDARLSVRISREAYQRLFVQSVMDGQTASEILDRVILAACREYSLPGKIVARTADTHRVVPTPELNCNAAPPPSQVAA